MYFLWYFQIQEQEERKLRTTVKLQLARQKVQDCDSDDEKKDEASIEVRTLLCELNDRVEDINDALEEIRYILADMREDLENDAHNT